MQIIGRLFFISVVFLLLSGCEQMNPEPIWYAPTSGEISVTEVSVDEFGPIRRTFEVYPKEIYFGDTIYMIKYDENTSVDVIHGFDDLRNIGAVSAAGTITTDNIQHEYQGISEIYSRSMGDIASQVRDLLPNEKRAQFKYYFELPPLEDLNHPFWEELRESMPPEGIKCQLKIKNGYIDDSGKFNSIDIIQDIVIKPRPESEMALIEKWYMNTPKKLFPEIYGNRKMPHEMDLCSSGKSDIKIGWRKYDPWMFVRLGNRKPSDPNNPTTLDGWRELERSLVPSTMRDEVRFVRLQLEFYAAENTDDIQNAKKEFLEWLKSLPEVQRESMTSAIISNMYRFKATSLDEKNKELIRYIYDILDLGGQENAHYRDRTLPKPQGITIFPPFKEVIEPTAADLAVGSKDLPDGFRIWDTTNDEGPMKMVAKFIELKEPDNVIVLESRDGTSLNMIFSALSKEDQDHARKLGQE